MDRRTFVMAGTGLMSRFALPPGVVAVAGCSASTAVADTVGFGGATMGTRFSVRLGAQLEREALAELEAEVHAALAEVERRMSTYDPASELARFNGSSDTGWQTLSADTMLVIQRALATSDSSNGAFDATVGPLVNLWGFGPEGTVSHPPTGREVAALRERVGWRHVEVDASAGAARKSRADAYLDLCGIAKGYGVDAVVKLLASRGFEDCLVEVGGELATRGRRPGGAAWRVGIEEPTSGARQLRQLVDLKNRAIATSGDYRNFFEDSGRHYSHTIDPRTGYPIAHALASVSVIADDATEADAASTALMVMGPEAGPEWAHAHGVAAYFMLRAGAGLQERATPAFDEHRLG